jgi:hypothetical protein
MYIFMFFCNLNRYEINYVIGPLFFIMFVGIAFLVVLNIIIAIVADAYVQANEERKVYLNKKRALKEASHKDFRAGRTKIDPRASGFKALRLPKFRTTSNKVASAVYAKKAAVLISPKRKSSNVTPFMVKPNNAAANIHSSDMAISSAGSSMDQSSTTSERSGDTSQSQLTLPSSVPTGGSIPPPPNAAPGISYQESSDEL